ncbi:hypothetical protein NQF86_06280 [Bombella sp. TMW 2.2543]|uniref:Uncharacterized protein n=1 Tax=Bombella pluederhausensis TaxID=2967336 RepID=A0ABT3WKF6_9PROT|nr:hypothetical protein [Bombella pluederhausensis]MCX5618272.1 hypothetical protein [Bombella pluederhausensis]
MIGSALLSVLHIVLELCLQCGVLLLLLPLMFWLEEDVPALLVGRAVAPLRERYRRFAAFWREILRTGLPLEDGLMLALGFLAVLCLAGLSLVRADVGSALGAWLADPLLMGGILLVGAFWAVPGRFRAVHGRCCFALCLTECFLVLAAPGVTGLQGVQRLLLAAPGSSLAGTSLCCAAALALTTSLPDFQVLADEMVSRGRPASRLARDQRQVIVSIHHVGWALLLGDLLLPVLFGLEGPAGVIGLVIRFGGGSLLVALGRLTGMSRNGRLVALLLGLAGLMALAGRFAV